MTVDPKKFSDLVRSGTRGSSYRKNARFAVSWFMDVAKKNGIDPDSTKLVSSLEPGNMYMFSYDAKHKATLPYYDANPLIFPLEMYNDGFLGLNFHYLPLQLRAVVMDSLYYLVGDASKLSKSSKMNLSYRTLMKLSQNKYFKPCIKRYLYTQLRSRYIKIDPEAWDQAIFLPVENFQGASSARVWADSLKEI